MGGGSYSSSSRSMRAEYKGYATKSATEIFSRNLNSAMSPNGVDIRESRDSAEHPNSVAIIIALDVTGSMGSIPLHLVRDGLPTIMQKIFGTWTTPPPIDEYNRRNYIYKNLQLVTNIHIDGKKVWNFQNFAKFISSTFR